MKEIRRVLIWSGWLRASHWAVALSTLVLIFTGLLISYSPMQAEPALEYHYLAVSVLVFGIALRIAIFFRGAEHERLPALFPQPSELKAIKQTLLAYLTLGKQPLPHWYAHNPFWKIIYVIWYLALLLLIASGSIMPDTPVVAGFYLPSVHAFWATVIMWLAGLHLLALIAHDYYAKTTDISAMINGYRLFEVDGQSASNQKGMPVVVKPLDSLINKDEK